MLLVLSILSSATAESLKRSQAREDAIQSIRLRTGDRIPQDFAKALTLAKSSFNQGDPLGAFALSRLYSLGLGVPKDEQKGNELAERALPKLREEAEKGDDWAMMSVGFCYQIGFGGVTKDGPRAAACYEKAAALGNDNAELELGWMYESGTLIPQDYAQALNHYRIVAEKGHSQAQYSLGNMYAHGRGVPKDHAEGAKWFLKAAEQGHARAQNNLGVMCETGYGMPKDLQQAAGWYRKAAEGGDSLGQYNLGMRYGTGEGLPRDDVLAAAWLRKSAEQGCAQAQRQLGYCYHDGKGVAKDFVEAYRWLDLAAAQGDTDAKSRLAQLETVMSAAEVAAGQKLTRDGKRSSSGIASPEIPSSSAKGSMPIGSGSGFFITDDGYLVTNYHVVKGASRFEVKSPKGNLAAQLIRTDAANDLAVLKVEGQFMALPVIASRTVKLGETVTTIGFPDTALQGFSPKLAKGEIASLAGIRDDPRYFQISVPIQPGNSGGALVDAHGNVVGVVSGTLKQEAALAVTGALAQSVNYAVKSSYLLNVLESIPEVNSKMKAGDNAEKKFDQVVDSATQAAVLLLVY